MTLVLRDARETDTARLATKADLDQGLSTLRSETQALRAELKSDMQALELRLEARIEAGKAETIKWVVSAIGFQTIVLVGAVVALSRLFQS